MMSVNQVILCRRQLGYDVHEERSPNQSGFPSMPVVMHVQVPQPAGEVRSGYKYCLPLTHVRRCLLIQY